MDVGVLILHWFGNDPTWNVLSIASDHHERFCTEGMVDDSNGISFDGIYS